MEGGLTKVPETIDILTVQVVQHAVLAVERDLRLIRCI